MPLYILLNEDGSVTPMTENIKSIPASKLFNIFHNFFGILLKHDRCRGPLKGWSFLKPGTIAEGYCQVYEIPRIPWY